jgi:hypothetical protein
VLIVLVVLPIAHWPAGRWRMASRTMLGVSVGSLFLVNLAGSVWLQTQGENDYWRARTAWYEENTGPTDIVFTTSYLHAGYLDYFTDVEVVDVRLDIGLDEGEDQVIPQVQGIIDRHPDARILFSSEALFPAEDDYSHCIEPNCTIGKLMQEEYVSRSLLVSDGELEDVWQLER